jgi:hypothetical protein
MKRGGWRLVHRTSHCSRRGHLDRTAPHHRFKTIAPKSRMDGDGICMTVNSAAAH